MEFDPRFANNFPHLNGIFPDYASINSEISTMVPVQSSSSLSPHLPSIENLLYQNNYLNFQQLPLNGANHFSSFSMKGSSSTNQTNVMPTPSLGNLSQAAHNNGSMANLVGSGHPLAYLPNFNKTECVNGYPNNGISYFDLVNKNPLQRSGISQHQVDPSLSPLSLYDADAYVPMKIPQDELLQIVGMGNNFPVSDLTLDVCSQYMQLGVNEKNNESHNIDSNIIKHQWTVDEDRILVEMVNLIGLKKWAQIAKFIDGKNGKQCRERWTNHLQPNIRKESWSYEEEKILIEAHKEVGNKWAEIVRRLPGRTENTVKNYWNSTKRRLATKRKQKKGKARKETLLEKYIMDVTNAEGDENDRKKSMRTMDIASKDNDNNKNELGLGRGHHESSEGDLNSKGLAAKDIVPDRGSNEEIN